MIHLITQYYNPQQKERQDEINYCLKRNLNNPAISTIHNLVEKRSKIPKQFRRHKKIIVKEYRRLTYAHCFDYIKNFADQEIVIICNNDIFIDDQKANPWLTIKEDFFDKNSSPKVLNLSRHEYDANGKIWKEGSYSSYSSDTWILQVPILKIPDCNFHIGVLCADWAIAGRLRDAGYHVYNWADKYITYHLDRILDRATRHPKRKKHTETNSLESTRSRLFICPYLNYEKFLKCNVNPQNAQCVKKCVHQHQGKHIF